MNVGNRVFPRLCIQVDYDKFPNTQIPDMCQGPGTGPGPLLQVFNIFRRRDLEQDDKIVHPPEDWQDGHRPFEIIHMTAAPVSHRRNKPGGYRSGGTEIIICFFEDRKNIPDGITGTQKIFTFPLSTALIIPDIIPEGLKVLVVVAVIIQDIDPGGGHFCDVRPDPCGFTPFFFAAYSYGIVRSNFHVITPKSLTIADFSSRIIIKRFFW
nr:hypothetical protein [uncultured Methanoregula sp.]